MFEIHIQFSMCLPVQTDRELKYYMHSLNAMYIEVLYILLSILPIGNVDNSSFLVIYYISDPITARRMHQASISQNEPKSQWVE